MWFWLAVGTLLLWSGADLLSKIGCSNDDPYSYLKMVMAVGLVMGIHAHISMLSGRAVFTWETAIRYAPVSLLYISSMTIGYLGLRYIELSISSPICNSSGALTALMSFAVFGFPNDFSLLSAASIALTCGGVIGLGVAEATETSAAREARQALSGRTYSKAALALLLPVLYCVLDATGTLADSIVLETLNEENANVAYELTFLLCGIVCAVYVLGFRRQKPVFREELPKLAAAVCETGGQYLYIHAMSYQKYLAYTAPVISAYCALSVVWAGLILHERLSARHYAALAATITGIILMGVFGL